MSSPVVHIERIEYVTHNHVDMGEVLSKLNHLIQHQHELMSLTDDLKAQVASLKEDLASLQTSVDLEQSQIAALLATNAEVVSGLNAQIATLQEQLANSPTPEALQEVITELTTVRDSIATTKADIEGTVE
jgi:chromosome segregation ATPase